MEKKAKSSNPIARLGRFILFMLSCGYLYPHVLTENMDMKAYEAGLVRTPTEYSSYSSDSHIRGRLPNCSPVRGRR